MTFKMEQLLTINTFYQKISTTTLPIKTTYKLMKLYMSISKEIEFYKTEVDKLLQQYAVLDENGKPKLNETGDGFQLKEECLSEAVQKLNELSNLEVELPNITFTIEEFEPINLTMEELNTILPLIAE